MLSRIHVYAASLGLLLAGPTIATGQSSSGVVLERASAAAVPSYEVMGFPITPHQFSVVGSVHVEEQMPSPSLMMAGMPASPHQVTVLTPRARKIEELAATTPIGMLTALILICSAPDSPELEECTRKNAAVKMRVPAELGTPITCLMHAQAYLAETSIGQDLSSNDRVKIICERTETAAASMQRR
jgi:hypothetical protein